MKQLYSFTIEDGSAAYSPNNRGSNSGVRHATLKERNHGSDPNHRARKLEIIDIETTFKGEIGGRGAMFDIRAKTEPVRIRSLSFHAQDENKHCRMRVFTKKGSHRGFEESIFEWTKVVDAIMECKGPQIESMIESFMFDQAGSDDLLIEPNSVRGIYIDCPSYNALRYSLTYDEGEVFVEDDYVQILEGTGLIRDFADLHSPRMWNGILTYDLIRSDQPTQTPTQTLTGCDGSLSTNSNDSTAQSYGHMFNIGSNNLSGVTIYGIEFQTHETTLLHYEIYVTETTYKNFLHTDQSDWTEVAKGSITGNGDGKLTSIVGRNFNPVTIKTNTTIGAYITLHTQSLRYANSHGKVDDEVFAQNNHIDIRVGIGVADYPVDKEAFFISRQFIGRILYRTELECPVSTPFTYELEVVYLKDLGGDFVLDEITDTVKSFVENFLEMDSAVKQLEKEGGNEISLLSTKTVDVSSPCPRSSDTYLCNTLVTTIEVGYFIDSDIGSINVLLLQQTAAVTKEISTKFTVEYVGDKLLVTKILLVLDGVPSTEMRYDEIGYLEETLKSFLIEYLHPVEILSVTVMDFDSRRERIANSQLETQIIINGKCRPSQDIDFNSKVEDVINFKNDELINDLATESVEAGASYFRYVKDVSVEKWPSSAPIVVSTVNTEPTVLSECGCYKGVGIMYVVIGAVLLTLVLIFGSYMIYKSIQKKRDKKELGNKLGRDVYRYNNLYGNSTDKFSIDKDIVAIRRNETFPDETSTTSSCSSCDSSTNSFSYELEQSEIFWGIEFDSSKPRPSLSERICQLEERVFGKSRDGPLLKRHKDLLYYGCDDKNFAVLIDQLEEIFLGKISKDSNAVTRIESLETLLFGVSKTGDMRGRLDELDLASQ